MKVALSITQRLTMRAGGLGGGPGKKENPGESIFPFRRLVLPPSR